MSLIYNASEIRAWDEYTIKNEPISSLDLMERAAEGCCKKLLGTIPFRSVALFCGKGNNGGDGLAISRLLAQGGIDVTLYICEFGQRASADFEKNLKRLPPEVKTIHLKAAEALNIEADVLVDCLFGSGLDRPITGWLTEVIKVINAHPSPTVAIDIPSGLYVSNNAQNDLKNCIRADYTFSFQTPKFPFFFAEYTPFVGRFSVIDIQLANSFKEKALALFLTRNEIKLKPLNHFGHKGEKGYLTLIAGSKNMLGAALLSSKAAFKTGCGYVGLISSEKVLTALVSTLPEAIWLGENPTTFPAKTKAIAIGPGLGKTSASLTLLKMTLKANLPLIIDADALNLLAENPALISRIPAGSILTPHLAELNRLIGTANSPEELLEKQKNFSVKNQVYIIQKGAYSKLTDPEGNVYINSTGNAGMATAGMGDALTGMIGSFLAQGYSPKDAAKNGMYYHGLAGDLAARQNGIRGLITSDLIAFIPQALNGF